MSHGLLCFTSIPQSSCLSLCGCLGLSLHFSSIWCLHQNLWQRLLMPVQVIWLLLCLARPVCVCLCVHLQRLTLSLLRCAGVGGAAFTAQIPHVQEPLSQTSDKLWWTCLGVIAEARHAEENVVWLGVVTRSISVWNNWSVAAEHLYCSRNLRNEHTKNTCHIIYKYQRDEFQSYLTCRENKLIADEICFIFKKFWLLHLQLLCNFT